MRHDRLTLAFGLLLGGPLLAQTTWYIDPVAGVDVPGGGSSAAPLRSLTFAVAQAGPGGPATFRLRAGLYGPATETFPIALPDVCLVEADPALPRGLQAVQIAGNPTGSGHTAALRVGANGTGPVNVALRNLLLEGALGNASYIAVQIDGAPGAGVVDFLAEDCVMDHYRDLVVLTSGTTVATVTARRCTLRGLDEQIRVTARGTSTVQLNVDRGVLSGAWVGADLHADGGIITTNLRGARLIDHGLYGIRMGTTLNGTIGVRAEHCLFRKAGRRVINIPTGGYGALVEDAAALAGTRQVVVDNSIFWGNVNDAPMYDPSRYTFGANIVQQANLVGVGGNRNVAPMFVDANGNDYRLLPGSPAIDAGVAAATTLGTDFEGDPRPTGAAPDLGPDEHWPLYLYTQGVAHVGGPTAATLTFRALGPAGIGYAAFVSLGETGQTWGPGVLHLAPPISGIVFLDTIGANGLGEYVFTLPVSPVLVGLETWWQGGFAVPPFVGSNPHRVLLRG